MIKATQQVRAMAPYALADLGGGQMISLAQNESAFPVSPQAIEAGQKVLAQAPLYPDPDWHDIRQAIAEVHGLDERRILCGAGSMELIGCLVRCFAAPGDQVLGTEFGYLFVASAAAQAGAGYVTVPEPNFTVSVENLLASVTPQTRIVFLCNPGNPTGTRLPNSEVIRLREALDDDVLLVIDQAYGEFDDQDMVNVFALVDRGDTVITRTFSKAYGMAGSRVGWGLFPKQIQGEVRKLLNPNNVPGVSQAMAAAAVRDQAHMRNVVKETTRIRLDTTDALRDLGFDIPQSHTNFILIPFADDKAATLADAALRREGILLRGMGGYGLAHCLRATIGSADIMQRVALCLTDYMEGTT